MVTQNNRRTKKSKLGCSHGIKELEKGVVYEFTFDQHKAPLSKKVSEYLEKEKEIEMNAIYQFDLKSIKLIDKGGSNQSSEDDIE